MASPNGEMAVIIELMTTFIDYQKQHNVRDNSNMIQNKWDMRDVYRHIGSDKEMKMLIRFYMQFSDDRTFKRFFMEYAAYYDKMLETIADRRLRARLAKETLEKTGSKGS